MIDICPCGSNKQYSACCEPFILASKSPDSAEQLMRSRYTAYTHGLVDYIAQTMRGKALLGYDRASAKVWSMSVVWLNLEVINFYSENENTAFVEFSAIFLQKNNKLQEIHELSEFKLVDGSWYYVDGKQMTALNKHTNRLVPVNTPCPCGSGRKFKSCHMRR